METVTVASSYDFLYQVKTLFFREILVNPVLGKNEILKVFENCFFFF